MQLNMRREWMQEFAATELAMPRAAFFGAPVTAQDLAWAWTVVTSRAFGLTPGAPHVLLPFVDFANHSPVAPAARVALSKSSGEMRLLAARDVRRGEPICISYGELPNDDLLLGYGAAGWRGVVDNGRDELAPCRAVRLAYTASALPEMRGGSGGSKIEPMAAA